MRRLSLIIPLFLAACSLFSAGETGDPDQPPASLPAPTSIVPAVTPPGSTPASQPAWKPDVHTPWQIVLSETNLDLSFPAAMVDIDLFDSDAATVAGLHAQNIRVVCYLSAGSWEDWRDDADKFPEEVLGNDYEGWPGEKWLDIRRIDLLAPILRLRLDQCAAKGFDGVDPDNLDGYTNDTGFPLTAQDQLAFNRWLAGEAHARGLAVGLKNDPDQAAELVSSFDWILTEACFDEGWCEQAAVFVRAGKPVFAIEYTDTGISLEDFCPQAKTLEINAILKHRELDNWIETCD